MTTLAAQRDDIQEQLDAAIQRMEDAPNVKKWQQAEVDVFYLKSERRRVRQEIENYGANGWTCSQCNKDFTEDEEPGDDFICEDCEIEMWDVNDDDN